MKEVVELYFGQYYGSSKKVMIQCHTEKGRFTLVDSIACRDCKVHTPDFESECDKVVAFIDSHNVDVNVLELEAFLNEYNGLKAIASGSKCDLMMYAADKVVFCDMTCSNPKYIVDFETGNGEHKIGKRLTVRGQIENAISLLCAVPEIAAAIKSRGSKEALFAYREKVADDMSDFDRAVADGMQSFDMMHQEHIKERMMSDLGKGFLFTEVRYPEVYEW